MHCICGLMYTSKFKQTGYVCYLKVSDTLSFLLETVFISFKQYLCSHIYILHIPTETSFLFLELEKSLCLE